MIANNINEIAVMAVEEMVSSGLKAPTVHFTILRGIDRINNMRGGLVINFGKYAGTAYKELPDDYRQWLRNELKAIAGQVELMNLVQNGR